MSLMISSSERAERSILVTMSCAAPGNSLRWSRYSMPRMVFIGVRISWLMLARKSDLDWLALLAASIARRSCFSCSFCSVRSTATPRYPITWSLSSRNVLKVSSTGRRRPSWLT